MKGLSKSTCATPLLLVAGVLAFMLLLPSASNAAIVGYDQYNGTVASVSKRTVVFTLPATGDIRRIMGRTVVVGCIRQVVHAHYQERTLVWKPYSESLSVTFKKSIGAAPVLCDVTTKRNPYEDLWIAVVAPGLGQVAPIDPKQVFPNVVPN